MSAKNEADIENLKIRQVLLEQQMHAGLAALVERIEKLEGQRAAEREAKVTPNGKAQERKAHR